MAGLLIKDLKNISNQFVYYLAAFLGLIIISVLTQNIYVLGGIVYLSVSLPLSALTADEKVNWDAFALAAGISAGVWICCVGFGRVFGHKGCCGAGCIRRNEFFID